MEVKFIYNGKNLIVQCNRYDIIGQIFHKFSKFWNIGGLPIFCGRGL